LAERLVVTPDKLLPRVILPFPAVVDRANVLAAVIEPDVVRLALLDTLMLLPVELPLPILRAVAPVPAQVTLPVVLKVKLLVEPDKVLILPEPEVRFKLVEAMEPPVWLIMPEPLADRLTVAPEALPPKLTLPLLAVVVRAKVPEVARAEVVERVLSLLTDKLEKVAPPEARLKAPAPLFTTVALPVVLRVRLGVEVLMLPILPEPEASDIELEPVKVPAD